MAGLLLARIGKLRYTKNAFLSASLLLIVFLSVPHLGGDNNICNRIFECFCIIILFPFVIWLGSGGKVQGKKAAGVCKFLGDISYPVYITHYPIAYVYMAWVTNNKLSLAQSWPYFILTVIVSITVAYLTMKCYDIPIRNWLRKKVL